ncbi:MAG: small ribosomal subunit Rsm22 family protein [Deltaproteobacteria bacterium]|nr:small ribosomal subunit Rsm22 family protein [Deltaproteobacteria bacterium]
MIQFPKDLEDFLLSYVKREFYRGTRRASFADRPFIREDLLFFSKGVADLSELFTADRANLQSGYLNQPQFRAGYILYFLPINFAKTRFVLDRFPEKFWKRKTYRVLDIGCGPGSASLAFLDALKKKNPSAEIELVLVEQNANVLADAQRLLRGFAGKLKIEIRAFPLWLHGFRFQGEYDLILMSHVLNEMVKYSAQERSEWLLPRLQEHLAPEGIVALTEPALKRPTRELMALRDHLIEDKEFCVLGPCLHDEVCPMLAATRSDWCHFYLDWDEPEYLQALDRMVKNDNHFLKVAYVLLGRTAAWKKSLPRGRDTYRVVSNRMQNREKTEAVLCGPPGRLTVSRLNLEKRKENSALDKVRRGDLLQIQGWDRKDFEVGRTLRLSPKQVLKILP